MKKKILFVCLGNICRSPAAEGVFLSLIHAKGLAHEYEIDSAGTGGWHIGKQADSRMRNSAMNRGIDIPSLARQINPEDLEYFDLILTMDQDNLNEVKSLAVKAGLDVLSKIRPVLSYSKSTDVVEVPDPYYGGEKGFERVLDLLEEACYGLYLETRQIME